MTWRALTPVGWMAAGLVILAAAAVVLSGLGFRWDPFDRSARRIRTAEAAAAAAVKNAAARSLEVEGERTLNARSRDAAAATAGARAATIILEQQSGAAPDAHDPLSPERLARLRAHDDSLCRADPDLGGCAAPAGRARTGDDAVSSADAADDSEPG